MRYSLTTAGFCTAGLIAFSLAGNGQTALSAPNASPCADPAADIELALISKSGPSTGRVRITGIVKNLGNVAWVPASPSHRLHMVLAQREAGAPPEGASVQPTIAIQHLAAGQQFRIDHQVNWSVGHGHHTYPRYILRFFDAGQAGARSAPNQLDCRADNNHREITAADIDKLFQPPLREKALKAQSYRLLGGVGVNTVEASLAYKRSSANAGRITASVAAPYTGTSDEVLIEGSHGSATIRVHIPCDAKDNPLPNPPPVSIIYRLWGSLSLPGGSGWVPSSSIEQLIPYRELCHAGAVGKTRR